MANNYQKEQAQNITATPQELDAWEALRREPGLMGRLARRGKHMKRDYVGGRRSFQGNPHDNEKGSGSGSYEERAARNEQYQGSQGGGSAEREATAKAQREALEAGAKKTLKQR